MQVSSITQWWSFVGERNNLTEICPHCQVLHLAAREYLVNDVQVATLAPPHALMPFLVLSIWPTRNLHPRPRLEEGQCGENEERDQNKVLVRRDDLKGQEPSVGHSIQSKLHNFDFPSDYCMTV